MAVVCALVLGVSIPQGCMMPELTPELYVGTLDINAGEVIVNQPPNVINVVEETVYGEPYLKIASTSVTPAYFITTPNFTPSEWERKGLVIHLVDEQNVEGTVNLVSLCTFTDLTGFTTPGSHDVVAEEGGKQVYFSMAVFYPNNPNSVLVVKQLPGQRVYGRPDTYNWDGLMVTEVDYDGINQPAYTDYAWNDASIDSIVPESALSSASFGLNEVVVTKDSLIGIPASISAQFNVLVKQGPVKLHRPNGTFDWFETIFDTLEGIPTGIAGGYTPYTIELFDDVPENNTFMEVPGNTKITMIGNGAERKIHGDVGFRMGYARGERVTTMLVLGNHITLDGEGGVARTGSMIYLEADCTLEMLAGSKITGVTIGAFSSPFSSAVEMWNNAVFNMRGGEISYCKSSGGGAVAMQAGVSPGAFTMYGGEIHHCEATGYGGGVRVAIGNVFNLRGGTIRDCVAQAGGGVAVMTTSNITSGWLNERKEGEMGKFYMYGGTLIRNKAVLGNFNPSGVGGGVFAQRGTTVIKFDSSLSGMSNNRGIGGMQNWGYPNTLEDANTAEKSGSVYYIERGQGDLVGNPSPKVVHESDYWLTPSDPIFFYPDWN
jgi:hypothetical protein